MQVRRKLEVGHSCLDLAKLGDVEIIRWGPKLQHKYPTSNGEQKWRKMKKMR